MRLTFERLSGAGAVSAPAVTATVLLGSVPAAADADREHAPALAAVQKAVRSAPDALGLKVNESVLAAMSTAELKAALEIIPSSFELVESPVTKSSGAVSTLAAAATKGCKEKHRDALLQRRCHEGEALAAEELGGLLLELRPAR